MRVTISERAPKLDPFLLLLLLTVGIAVVLPARGAAAGATETATTVAIGLLFLLYGACLSTGDALRGLRHWRLHTTVLVATFVLFPLLGLAAGLLPAWLLPAPLAAGVLFGVLPAVDRAEMAGVLFSGHAVALVVLPVMLFHQIQLMVCATIAGRLARRRAVAAEETMTA